MTLREEIVEEARSWLDTPFRHQGRKKGVAIDCAGIVEAIAYKFNLTNGYEIYTPEEVRLKYSRVPDGALEQLINTFMDRVEPEERQPGDVALISWSRLPQHVAVFSSKTTIIHAYMPARKVVEVSFSPPMQKVTVGYFKYKGL